MNKDLTIGIATCGRPRVLKKCLDSIKDNMQGEYSLIVLDNTKAFTKDKRAIFTKYPDGTRLIEVDDKKIGCCESNNLIAESCGTNYLMHLDDDCIIPNKTVIPSLLNRIESSNDDIVSCMWKDTFYNKWRHSCMKYIQGWKDERKIIKKLPIPYQFGKQLGLDVVYTDEALHSMIVDMKVYDKIKWDNNFKWKGDRLDFFLQCKVNGLKVSNLLNEYVIHDPKEFRFGSLSYEDFGGKEAIEYFYKKWNMYPIVGWDKKQKKPGNI